MERYLPRSAQAFTLIELLVVIAILALLLAIAIPAYISQQTKAKDAGAKVLLTTSYHTLAGNAVSATRNGGFPQVTSMLSEARADQPQLSFASGIASGSSPLQAIYVARANSSQIQISTKSSSGNILTLIAAPTTSTPITFTSSSGAFIKATAVVTSVFSACALMEDKTVYCWGDNRYGQIGNGVVGLAGAPVAPTQVIGVTNAIKILSGQQDSFCALISNGTVDCWGNNNAGQMGGGVSGGTQATAAPVSGINTATELSGGGVSFCAVLSGGGAVKCWGSDFSYQLGDQSNVNKSSPVSVTGLSGASQAIMGTQFACALASGTIYCWGSNATGQIGNGNFVTPQQNIQTVSGITTATYISAGSTHACAIISGGTVKCWGQDNQRQLGDNSVSNSNVPVVAVGVSNAIALSGGVSHTCALISGGTIQCWGFNANGQLGEGNNASPQAVPTAVSGINNAVSISVQDQTGCAALSDGTVKCWGVNSSGQLGDGTQVANSSPVSVVGLP